jgi:signal transduction histidine kinase
MPLIAQFGIRAKLILASRLLAKAGWTVSNGRGTWLIYPPNPRNEGKSVLNVKDSNGKLLVQEIIQVARDKGEGWVEYHWLYRQP